MEVTPKVAAMLLVLVAGVFLVLIGVMGTVTADCPRPIVQFPEARLHCTAFTSLAALGTLMALGGGITAPIAALLADIRKGRQAGREA